MGNVRNVLVRRFWVRKCDVMGRGPPSEATECTIFMGYWRNTARWLYCVGYCEG